MNSKQISNKNIQIHRKDEISPVETENFPQEQISFDFNPFDDQPVVIIEYEDDDPDPLALDGSPSSCATGDSSNFYSLSNGTSNINIYHPFSHQEVEDLSDLSLARSPDSFYQTWPPIVGSEEPEFHSEKRESSVVGDYDVSVISRSSRQLELEKAIALRQLSEMERSTVSKKIDSDSRKTKHQHKANDSINCSKSLELPRCSLAAGTQTDFNDDYVIGSAHQNTPGIPLVERIIDFEDDTSDIMQELGDQMLRKIEERKLAANQLKQKRAEENAFAKKVAREIMKSGSQLFPNGPESGGHAYPTPTSKQLKDAETALAKKLLLQMSKGCSLEESILSLQSPTPSTNSKPADSKNQKASHQVSVSENRVDNEVAQRSKLSETEAASAKQSKRRKSFESIQTAASRPVVTSNNTSTLPSVLPSYSVAFNRGSCMSSTSSVAKRILCGQKPASRANICDTLGYGTSDGVTQGQTQMGAKPQPAKRRKSSGCSQTLTSWPASSSNSCVLPPASTCSIAFDGDCCMAGSSSAIGQIHNDERWIPMPHHPFPSYVPYSSYLTNQPMQQASQRSSSSTLLSTVHPSHLLPPSSLVTTVGEAIDLLVPEISNALEVTSPTNLSHFEASAYFEP